MEEKVSYNNQPQNPFAIFTKIIIATAILHNIATLWSDPLPEGEEEDDEEERRREREREEEEDQQVELQYALGEVQVRLIGQAERDNMLRQFIP